VIGILIIAVFGIAILGTIISIFSSPPAKNGEEAKRSIGATFLKGFVLLLIAFFFLIAWPDFGHPHRNPRNACNANSRVIAAVIEKCYEEKVVIHDPINLGNGKIDLRFLVEKGYLKAPVTSFPDCIYVGFPYASGAVEVFCLSCGFPDQEAPTIKEEFLKRFAIASPTASRMVIDFSATKDCSQQDSEEYFSKNRTFLGQFPALRELFGVSKYRTVVKK